MTIEFRSLLTCPHCGHSEAHVMPDHACLFFHECATCHAVLRPHAGHCCVFCSYGTIPCPPMQQNATSCCPAPETFISRLSRS
ncbi:MAG: GDCCVxC domain-containing (seleno)protein [Gemmatimonadota bacterium]